MADVKIRFPGGRYKALTLSYDDGSFQDARLAEIMVAHGIKGTFNLNSGRFQKAKALLSEDETFGMPTEEQVKERYVESHFEVATHALTHPYLDQMTSERMAYEIIEDRKNLERIMGYPVRGHAYPYGTYDQRVKDCLRACGIVYARTVPSTHQFHIPADWLQWDPTCHHADPKLMDLTDYFLEDFAPDAPDFRRQAKLFYVWGHSFEFDRANNWDVIERFAEKVGGREDVWYCTNMEFHDYVEAFRHLIYTADGTQVYNGSALDLWAEREGITYKIPAGNTVKF